MPHLRMQESVPHGNLRVHKCFRREGVVAPSHSHRSAGRSGDRGRTISSGGSPAMRTPALVALLALALALPAAADTVRLKNGRAYEDVIAERTPEGVRIQLAFGHIVIPDSQVASVE